MPFTPSVIKWITKKRLSEIDLFRKYPAESQEEVLTRLLARSRETTWGKEHGYASVANHRQFCENVHIQTYEELIPFVGRMRTGEKDLLWPGEIRWFAKSSGTTSTKSKFIPITRESLEGTHFRGAKDCLVLYTSINPATKIFLGKGLTLGGSSQISNFGNNSIFGDLSAILIENAPGYSDLIRTPPAHIALISDFEEKMKMITKKTVDMNITSLSGVPSWYLVLIRHILKTTGKENLHQVWPNLEVFFHGGISFAPYRKQYQRLLPDSRMNYMETYNASEGFFAIQDDLTDSSMLLMLDYGVYYEFIPAEATGSDNPRTYTIGEVEKGVNYAVVISTDGGLWRYTIGDTVEFTSLFPHKIKITGRTKHFINAFGEEVIIDNAEKALEKACLGTGAHINEYTAGPVYMGDDTRGSHEWVIEFEKKPDDTDRFIDLLDDELKALNSDYEAKRYKDLTLGRPIVRFVPSGTFYKWFRERDKLGGQNKMPRLSNNREYVESVLKTAGN
ncbi:MAG: GH3 auxin-responsive promoter family protein [Bacteroidales bacterium]